VTLTLEREARQRLLLLALTIGVASALLAMLQVLDGSQIGLYFYDFTNVGRGVGFFANANHFGAFEYMLLPLGVATLAETRARSPAFVVLTVGCIAPALMFALALTGSRSAIILGSLSAVATLVFVLAPERSIIGPRRAVALAAVFVLTLLPVAIGLGLLQILSRFAEQSVVDDARWRISASAWAGLWSYFPVGAGIGTFESVYPLHERVTDLVWQRVNRAHNDALETLFEGGGLSLVLLLAFVGWLVNSTYCALVRQDAVQGRHARAGAIALWLLLVHSLWDYPLRTVALETLFSLSWLCNSIRPALE